MKETTLVVKDFVNIKFSDLELSTRRKLVEELKYMVPNARHMPQYKLGRWDGTISFCTAGGASYFNLLDRLIPIVMADGYDIVVDDHRPVLAFEFPEITDELFADKVWPEGHEMAGEPIILRDYQVEAVQRFTENLQSVQEISTGSGKTILTAALSSLVECYGRSIIIVPNKSLVIQTEEDYRNIGLDVGIYYGDRKEWDHKHTICTWQSLAVFSKRTKSGESEIPIEDFLKDVVCVIVDEVHSAKATELKNLLTGPFANVPIRWGLTGTIPKEEHEAISILASIGPKVGEVRASDLQEQGVLSNCEIEIRQLNDDHVEFYDYETEHKFLLGDVDRLQFIVDSLITITSTGNTLVLIDRIEAGETLQKFIPDSVFISGAVKTKNRQTEYKSIQGSDNKLIIATYGVASIGINIPRIFNLVLIEAGKSFVRTIQSIGRGLRKASDKDKIFILDLCSSLKFSRRHVAKRREYYRDAGYPYTIKKIAYR